MEYKKLFTIYDNMNGGFTIMYQYYDKYNNKIIKKTIHFEFKQSMIKYKNNLEMDGYKFVGKL